MKEELSSFHIDQGQQQRVWFESNLELVNTEIKIPLIVANNLSFWVFFFHSQFFTYPLSAE